MRKTENKITKGSSAARPKFFQIKYLTPAKPGLQGYDRMSETWSTREEVDGRLKELETYGAVAVEVREDVH